MTPTDNALIFNIKKGIDVGRCLDILMSRHTGIYIDVITKLVPISSPFCDRSEIIDDKTYNIYSAALIFDEKKNAKFSTFLANYTRYLCLNLYNKAKKKPMLSKGEEFIVTAMSATSKSSADRDTLIKEIYEIVDSHPDHRVGRLMRLRYEQGDGNKTLPWREVAPEVGLSIQGCINVHDSAIQDLQKKLNLDNKL